MLHVRRYFTALAILCAMFCAYAYGVAPLVAPPVSKRQPAARWGGAVSVSPELRDDLARLFTAPAWELENPIVVEAEQCTLLVQEYLPTPDGRLELKPCTVIFYTKTPEVGTPTTGAPPARRPVVMQAPEGAVLQFDEPLDIAKGQFGKVIGGRLEGLVTITSPPSTPGASDALWLTTRNVQFDENRVFTPHEVEFRFGESYGRGRDLTIALIPEEEKAITPLAANSDGGIQSLTLARIDRLRLVPAAEASSPKDAAAVPAMSSAADDAPIELRCQGPFVLDMTQQLATFDDRVEVLRLVPGGMPDRLRCDRLLIELAGRDAAAANRIDEAAAAKADDSMSGRVERVIALGSPATLDAPSNGASASAARMEYSLLKKRIVLVPGPGSPQVTLRQETQHFTARELEYEFAEAGRLGRLWAAGPGELRAIQTRGLAQQTLVARWEKELRIRPNERNHVISLIDKASISVEPLGRFDADELHLWVLEVPADEISRLPPTTESQPPAGKQAADKPTKPKFTIIPDRVLATGRVRLTSPQLDAEAARLEAWFMNLPAAEATPLSELPPIDRGSGGVARAGLLQPDPAAGPTRLPKLPSVQKFHVNGELVQLQVVVQGKKLDLHDLLIRKQALIEETRTPEPGQEPIRIRGDSIELRHGTTEEAKIEVTGQPAEVGGRGMSLAGNVIHVHRGQNRIWIDGPGEATLPLPDEGSLAPPGLPAGPVRQPPIPMNQPLPNQPPAAAEKMYLVWQQGLNFDGLTTKLSGGVEGRTATQLMRAQTLEATLTGPVDFSATDKRPKVELGRLHLDGGVYVQNDGLDEAGQKVSHDMMQVKNLTFDRVGGTLHADGPGWVSTVRKTDGQIPGIPGAAAAPVPAAAPPGDAGTELTSVHIAFERAIEGDLAKRTITFRHNVRTTYSPALDFRDQIVATRPADLGDRGILMTSDALSMTEMITPGLRWVEMQATGNTLIEGKTFTAQAARVGYTSDKEVMTVEGDGRADAQVWHQAAPGQARSYTSAQKFRYWLRTGDFEGDGFNVLELQQLGNLNFGAGRRNE